jgi:hypothetical protein
MNGLMLCSTVRALHNGVMALRSTTAVTNRNVALHWSKVIAGHGDLISNVRKSMNTAENVV